MAEMTDLFRRLMRYIGAEIHVMLPARVVNYDFTIQKADVQPVLKRRYADGQEFDAPIISSVPVIWPRAGGASLTFPVNRGDFVMLVFADVDIDTWVQEGGVAAPDDPRQHSIMDAIAIPGLIPFNAAGMAENNTDVLLAFGGGKVRIKPNGNIDVEAQQVNIDAGTVRVSGNLDVEGSISTGPINLTTHVHGGVQSGSGSTGTPV